MNTTAEHGLLATTRYVPRLRLERSEVFALHRWMAPGLRGLAKGRRAMAHWDEDVVTMAVEAARQLANALNNGTDAIQTFRSQTDQDISVSVARLNDLLSQFQAANNTVIHASQAGTDASDAGLAILAYQLQNSEPLSLAEEDEAIVFDSEIESLESFLRRVEAQVNR